MNRDKMSVLWTKCHSVELNAILRNQMSVVVAEHQSVGINAIQWDYRGTSLIRNNAPPIGPPQGPSHNPTVGS